MLYLNQNSTENPAITYFLNTKAKTTKQKDRYVLSFFTEFTFNEKCILSVDWSKISKTLVLEFIENKIETAQFNTVNNYLTVLQLFAKECYQQGVIDFRTYESIKGIKKYRGVAPDTGRALNLREIKKISEYLTQAKSARDIRNYAIFALALGAGLRRAEIVSVNIEHIKKRELHVSGKGNKARTIYLGEFAFNAVNNWKNQVKASKGALFTKVYQGESIKTDRLTIRAINHVIDEINKKCNTKKFTTHDLRRTFATSLLYADNDIFTVQDLMGHSDPMTTKRYDKRGLLRKTKAVQSLPF